MAACLHATAKVAGIPVPATVGIVALPDTERVRLTVTAGSFPPAIIELPWGEAGNFAQTLMQAVGQAAASLTQEEKGTAGF